MSNDSTRRAEFTAYFEKHFGTDRQRFMDQFGVSKGRMTQYLDEEEAFGERAALNLEKRAHLPIGTKKQNFQTAASDVCPYCLLVHSR